MKTMRKVLCLPCLAAVAAGLLALLAISASAQEQTNDSPRILFLLLKFKNNSVSLVESSVQPGYLKPRPVEDIPDGIHFDLISADGQALWRGVIENPSRRVVEFEEPPRSGKLKRKIIPVTEAEFTVRVPARADVRRIEFYTLQKSEPESKGARKSLGSFDLPLK
jgi:hypothetical protein